MKFDDHRITIRERGTLELLDLSLRVMRSQAGPLFVALLAGIAPFALLNAWLLDGAATATAGDGPPAGFLAMMLVAVLWELPLATAPATMCLGRALFNQPLNAGRIARELFQSLPQLLWHQVFIRGLLMATVVGSVVPFLSNPYLNEVILLERNPLRAAGRKVMSTGARSSMLHRGQGGEFAFRGFLNGAVGLVLVGALWGSLAATANCLLDARDWTGPFFTCLYPAALWIVAAYFTVARFLGYLDLRIRREGWEAELLMRAELDRWTRIPQAN